MGAIILGNDGSLVPRNGTLKNQKGAVSKSSDRRFLWPGIFSVHNEHLNKYRQKGMADWRKILLPTPMKLALCIFYNEKKDYCDSAAAPQI